MHEWLIKLGAKFLKGNNYFREGEIKKKEEKEKQVQLKEQFSNAWLRVDRHESPTYLPASNGLTNPARR